MSKNEFKINNEDLLEQFSNYTQIVSDNSYKILQKKEKII